MTTHELAKLLLAEPDREVLIGTFHDSTVDCYTVERPIKSITSRSQNRRASVILAGMHVHAINLPEPS